MKQVLDLHIHSKYSRACSSRLEPKIIEAACREKGVDIVATGDFTHPTWFALLEKELTEYKPNSGLYKLKNQEDDKVKFIFSTELALIYKSGGKCRRIHVVLHAPNMESARELNKILSPRFNLKADGRPILGLGAEELAKICLKINPKFLIYPAHIWTPWFSVFGSKSGFNSMEECFGDQTEHIFAFETGLSSDPEMNWQVSALDQLTVLSNSDAHSPENIGREANVFEMEEITYQEIYNIIKNKKIYNKPADKIGIKYTIEFYPEEGMYHLDGHRNCAVSFTPAETKKHKNICPVCGKEVVVGVMNRVEELADRKLGEKPANAAPFKKLVSLDKIIAEALDVKSRTSLKVKKIYSEMIKKLGNELFILEDADLRDVEKFFSERFAEAIRRVRTGELNIQPGFDGQYGVISIFNPKEKNLQKKLF